MPVIVTEKVVVVVTVPLKVTTSVSFCPATSVTGVVAGLIVSPVPPVKVDEIATWPANPEAVTPAAVPDGRLPIVSVSVVEAPDANERLGPVGVPLDVVMLKFCGLMMRVIGCDFV